MIRINGGKHFDLLAARAPYAQSHYYELYGQFPRGPFAGLALCDAVDTPVDVTYEGDLQISVRIPHLPQSDRYCTFRVWRIDGSHSLAFGPVVACAVDTLVGPCF